MPATSAVSPSIWNGESASTTCARGAFAWIELEHRIDSFLRRAVHLVDDADVRHAQVRLARVVAQLVSGTVRIDDDDVEVGLDERRVVVAAVPEDHVGFLFRRAQDLLVVDPGEDEVSLGEMRLVLLTLLDRRVGGFEVLVALEALHGLFREISVRHRMAQDGDPLAGLAEQFGDASGGLALAGPVRTAQIATVGLRRNEHRLARRDQRYEAPAASAREPMCITCSCVTSE